MNENSAQYHVQDSFTTCTINMEDIIGPAKFVT